MRNHIFLLGVHTKDILKIGYPALTIQESKHLLQYPVDQGLYVETKAKIHESQKMSKILPNSKENNSKTRGQKISRGLLISIAIGVWAVLVSVVVWFMAAVGWHILANVWLEELFVPSAVFSSVRAGCIMFAWAVLISGIALLWTFYHYRRYYQRNRRVLLPVKMQADRLPWKQCFLDNSNSSVVMLIDDVAATTQDHSGYHHGEPVCENVIIGGILPEDFKNEKGSILLAKGETITPELIEVMADSGHYGSFVAHLSRQILETVEERRQAKVQ